MNVTLTAVSKTRTEKVHLANIVDDDDAMMTAIPVILNKAYCRNLSPWHIGEITLTDDADGRVIATMDSKE